MKTVYITHPYKIDYHFTFELLYKTDRYDTLKITIHLFAIYG